MDLQLTRLIISLEDSVYIADAVDHILLYKRLLQKGPYQKFCISKLRNNYHLGIL